jgi:hypothetical protein
LLLPVFTAKSPLVFAAFARFLLFSVLQAEPRFFRREKTVPHDCGKIIVVVVTANAGST